MDETDGDIPDPLRIRVVQSQRSYIETAAGLVDSLTCPTVWLRRDTEYLAFL
jgi:hypothetical protein